MYSKKRNERERSDSPWKVSNVKYLLIGENLKSGEGHVTSAAGFNNICSESSVGIINVRFITYFFKVFTLFLLAINL